MLLELERSKERRQEGQHTVLRTLSSSIDDSLNLSRSACRYIARKMTERTTTEVNIASSSKKSLVLIDFSRAVSRVRGRKNHARDSNTRKRIRR